MRPQSEVPVRYEVPPKTTGIRKCKSGTNLKEGRNEHSEEDVADVGDECDNETRCDCKANLYEATRRVLGVKQTC